MEQLVRDTGHTNTFTGIAECLGTTDQQHVVIRIACHGSLIRWFKRHTQVLAEIHGKVSQVLHHNHIILRSQLTNRLQFILIETDPRRVVGITIHDGADITLIQIRHQLVVQLLSTVVIHIEGLVLPAHHLQLHLLHRETRVDKQHRIFLLVSL